MLKGVMDTEKVEETTEFDDLVEAVGELTFRLGFEALDDDAEDFEIALDKWLCSTAGKKLLKLCDRAEKNDFEEQKLEAILAESCKEFAGRGPHRPTTALCVVVLAHAIDRASLLSGRPKGTYNKQPFLIIIYDNNMFF